MPFRHPDVELTPLPRKPPSSFRATSAPIIARRSTGHRLCRRVPACIALAFLVMIDGRLADAQPATTRPVAARSAYASLASFVAEASQRFGIPAAWIRAVMHAESLGEVHAISPKGAMGLMQIMPETWASLRQRYRFGADPYDAHDNIMAGAAYLRELHDRYGVPGFLAAYNAGPARWEDYLATGRPLPSETRIYLARLAPVVADSAADDAVLLASIVRSWTEASLFPGQPSDTSSSGAASVRRQEPSGSHVRPAQDWTGLAPQSNGLFVALSSGERTP